MVPCLFFLPRIYAGSRSIPQIAVPFLHQKLYQESMATFQKRGDAWRAIVRKKGISKSETFPTKTAAQAWAAQAEADIIAGKNGSIPNKTFGDLLDEYARKVSITKDGERWERIRIELLKRDEIAEVHLRDIDQPHFAAWRDRRLAAVSAATVRREWTLMSGACTVAMKEWKWLPRHPMKGVRRPAPPPPRDRLVSQSEHERMTQSFGTNIKTIIGRVLKAFLFSCETGMREGEVAGLTKDRVYLDRKFCKVGKGKTSAAKRDVPLSPEALVILEEAMSASETDSVFNLTTQQIDVHFRKGRDKALIKDLHYHDSRHVAITKLSKKLDILALARAVGIRDLKTLMVYYNETAEEMAKKL